MNKHTSGQWVASPEENNKEWRIDSGKWGIAICADAPGYGTAEANARLIAAAPELLEALANLQEAIICLDVTTSDKASVSAAEAAIAQARAAIVKATGESK